MRRLFRTLTVGVVLSLTGLSSAQAADCSGEWELSRREACEKAGVDTHWNDSQSNRRIQEYNALKNQQEREQQRESEQQAERDAALRREQAKRDAEEEERLRPARDQAAMLEMMRRMGQREADQRAREETRAKEAVRLEAIRARVIERVTAETQRLAAPGAPSLTANDFDRLVTLSIPEWDLMRHWAAEGLKRFPEEFAYRHAVVQTIGCPDRTYASSWLEKKGDCPLPANPPEALMNTRSASPPEQAVACGYRYLNWRLYALTFRLPLERDRLLPGPFRAWSPDEVAQGEREASRRWQAARACEAGLGAQSALWHDTVMERMTRLVGTFGGRYLYLDEPGQWGAFRRWYLVSRTVWGENPPPADAAAINRMLDKAEETYKAREPEWVFFQ